MQGRASPDSSNDLHARTLTVGALDVDNLIALPETQIDRLLNQMVQASHGLECRVAHMQAGFDQIAQFQKTHAQLVST